MSCADSDSSFLHFLVLLFYLFLYFISAQLQRPPRRGMPMISNHELPVFHRLGLPYNIIITVQVITVLYVISGPLYFVFLSLFILFYIPYFYFNYIPFFLLLFLFYGNSEPIKGECRSTLLS
jgi:hypothetical protein